MPARIIALEGMDQAGKRTQSLLLANHLKKKGLSAERVSFPIYVSASGKQIRRFLSGKHNYSPEALHMLYALNRWENQGLLHKLVERNDFVIADRYIPSNLAYGVARGLSLSWLTALDKGLPPANLVIVLDVPVPSSFARKREDRDVHESDRILLAKVRQSYRVLANKLHWRTIDATRPIAEVEFAIWRLVQQKFNPRHGSS